LKYQVQLDVYEGPLDLLLRRLNNEEIPAGEIPVCIIIDQFIDYYMGIAFSDLEEGSRFLVLAATLLAVKARLLLPRREEEDEESDTLLDQDDEEGLLETDFDEYLAFQDAAMTLEERAAEKAIKRFMRGPAAEISIIPFSRSPRIFKGLNGTGFAQPNPATRSRIKPMGSMCTRGLRLILPI
jgi:segregation and condensation protein A